MKYTVKLAMLIAASVGLCGCATVGERPASALETPAWHVAQGNTLLARGEHEAALREFDRALALDPKSVAAHVGRASTWLEKSDLEAAGAEIRQARAAGAESAALHVVAGRLAVARQEKDWLDDAQREYRRAQELEPANADGHYFSGVAYERALRFGEASAAFARVLELGGPRKVEANREWERLQVIERASPGTANGRRIALVERLTRAEMGILLADELGLVERLRKARPEVYDTTYRTPEEFERAPAKPRLEAVPEDIVGHWGESALRDVLKLGFRSLTPMPDRKFYPDRAVTRAEFAVLVEDVLILLTNDQALSRRYLGDETSHFPDVRRDHFAYNAANLAVERGILKAGVDGRFGIADPISGAEALLAIRTLEHFL